VYERMKHYRPDFNPPDDDLKLVHLSTMRKKWEQCIGDHITVRTSPPNLFIHPSIIT
jgi:hypothetical protein